MTNNFHCTENKGLFQNDRYKEPDYAAQKSRAIVEISTHRTYRFEDTFDGT